MELARQQQVLVEVNVMLQTPEFVRYKEDLDRMVEACRGQKVKDEETDGRAADMMVLVRGLEKRLMEAKKKALEERRSFITAVDKAVAGWCKSLAEAMDILKAKRSVYIRARDQKRQEQERKMRIETERVQKRLDKQAEKLGIEGVELPKPKAAKPVTMVRTDSGKVSETKPWKAELTDLTMLVKAVARGEVQPEYLVLDQSTAAAVMVLAKAVASGDLLPDCLAIDQKYANSQARAIKGAREVPGVRFYEDLDFRTYGT